MTVIYFEVLIQMFALLLKTEETTRIAHRSSAGKLEDTISNSVRASYEVQNLCCLASRRGHIQLSTSSTLRRPNEDIKC